MHLLDKNQWQGVEVITSDLVAKEHGVSKHAIKQLYEKNKKWFKHSEDVFVIDKDFLLHPECNREVGDLFTNNKQQAVYLFTKSGYLNLVKIMDSPRSWQVFEHMKKVYFKAEELTKTKLTSSDYLKLWQESITQEVKQISDKVDDMAVKIDYRPDYYTITAWVAKYKIKGATKFDYKALGHRAVTISKDLGYEVVQVPHPQYHSVGSYHKDVLTKLFYYE